jgi:sugar (pentulose or hexulose) kinase
LRLRGTLGVDVGTSSTKGVLVDGSGTVIRSATREHAVDRPHPGGWRWTAGVGIRAPDPAVSAEYDQLYSLYRELYTSTTATVHALAAREKRTTGTTTEEPR